MSVHGEVLAQGVTFPTGLTEAPDGAIWIGSYPEARLTKFEPESRTFTPYGRMDESEQYLYPLAGDDGSLAALVLVRGIDHDLGAVLQPDLFVDTERRELDGAHAGKSGVGVNVDDFTRGKGYEHAFAGI